MDDILYKGFSTYYDVITTTGYLPINRTLSLLVLDYLNDIVLNEDYLFITEPDEQDKINALYNCITKNNCLL